MKTLKQQFKSIALILSIIILFQGCTVYKSANITLEQAAQNGSKVRVRTIDNKKYKFNKIEIKNDKFFSIKNNNSVTVITPLNPEEIKTVNEKNKTLSLILSIGIPVVLYGGLFLCCRDGFGYQ